MLHIADDGSRLVAITTEASVRVPPTTHGRHGTDQLDSCKSGAGELDLEFYHGLEKHFLITVVSESFLSPPPIVVFLPTADKQ